MSSLHAAAEGEKEAGTGPVIVVNPNPLGAQDHQRSAFEAHEGYYRNHQAGMAARRTLLLHVGEQGRATTQCEFRISYDEVVAGRICRRSREDVADILEDALQVGALCHGLQAAARPEV